MNDSRLEQQLQKMAHEAKLNAVVLSQCSTQKKNAALMGMADKIRGASAEILSANREDLDAAAKKGLNDALLDRLALSEARLNDVAASVEAVAALDDPVGAIIKQWQQPNGLHFERRRVPLGVVGMIYESRPNVTVDAAALCLKSGNAVILRGGSESFRTNTALHQQIQQALIQQSLPESLVQLIPTVDRQAVGYLLSGLMGCIDLIIPRGGKNLIARVQQDARVPVLGHLEGICHVYVDKSAKVDMACDIVVNAKMRRTGVCGATETLLLDKALNNADQQAVIKALLATGCQIRGDALICQLDERVIAASYSDWGREFLAPIIAVAAVDGVDDAINHIRSFGSGHTEAIVAENASTVEQFLDQVDSAIVMHNASTQFADGGEFGMGAEIGIATGKLHARGPVGVEQLTSYKYVVRGSGQTRA